MARDRTRVVDDVAIEVWAVLVRAAHDGMSLREMVKVLPHFSLNQLRSGIERINHVLQQTREQPLIGRSVRGRGYVYKFPKDVGEYQAFAIRRMRELLTRAGTEVARAEAALLRWPDDLAPYVPKQIRRITEDIEDVIVDIQEAWPDDEG